MHFVAVTLVMWLIDGFVSRRLWFERTSNGLIVQRENQHSDPSFRGNF